MKGMNMKKKDIWKGRQENGRLGTYTYPINAQLSLEMSNLNQRLVVISLFPVLLLAIIRNRVNTLRYNEKILRYKFD